MFVCYFSVTEGDCVSADLQGRHFKKTPWSLVCIQSLQVQLFAQKDPAVCQAWDDKMNYMGCRTVTINKHRFVINGVSIHLLMWCDRNEQSAPLLLAHQLVLSGD